MEKNDLSFEEKAEQLITQKIKEVIIQKPQLLEEEDVRVETEIKILLLLTEETNSKVEDSDLYKEIEYIMNVFDKKFDTLYKRIQIERKISSEEKSKDIGER